MLSRNGKPAPRWLSPLLRIIVFLLLLLLVLNGLSRILSHSGDDLTSKTGQRINGFYAEAGRPLDAVYIGGSNVFCYWAPAVAWENHGITVYPYAVPSMSFYDELGVMTEARKTQPDALYIVAINGLDFTSPDVEHVYKALPLLHKLADVLPLSQNKFRLIEGMADRGGYSFKEKLELFYPMYRYHGRWNELVEEDFSFFMPSPFKGGNTAESFLSVTADVRKTSALRIPACPFRTNCRSMWNSFSHTAGRRRSTSSF